MSEFNEVYKTFMNDDPLKLDYAIDGVKFTLPVSLMNPVDFVRMMGVTFKPDRRKRVTRKRSRKAMVEAMRRHNDS